MSGILETNPWLLRKTVLPQNTDHAGVMWHGAYLSWLEEARINALLQVGLSYKQISNEGFEMPVIDLHIKYLSSLFHGDNVLLKSFVSQGKGPRWRWKTTFYRAESEKKVAFSCVDLVLIKKGHSGNVLLRKGPIHISQALFNLQRGQTP
tara:strand:+ start:1788 stop:2237 length:450 start_codon:yes stop_codon:yes gene_type:complete